METKPFIIERTFNAPVEKVWNAITKENEMKHWYFDLPGFKAEVGYEFEFDGGPDDRIYKHLCRVVEVENEKKLAYTWRYDGYEGNSLVTFELFPNGETTTLRLTHEGLETFPASNPDLAKKNFEQGWLEIVGTSLKKYLEQA